MSFAALAAKLQKWDKAKDIAEIVQKLFVKGGKLDKLMGKLDEIVNGVSDFKKAAQAKVAAEVAEAVGDMMCFTPNTLVSTATGLKAIGSVSPGEQVHAFDFEAGYWVLAEVQQRHDNVYRGEMVTIYVDESTIEQIKGSRTR
jgi:hypothetical protein